MMQTGTIFLVVTGVTGGLTLVAILAYACLYHIKVKPQRQQGPDDGRSEFKVKRNSSSGALQNHPKAFPMWNYADGLGSGGNP